MDGGRRRQQARLIEGGSGRECYEFALAVPDADIGRLQARLVAAGDPTYLRLFARDVEGAGVRLLSWWTARIGSARDCSLFAEQVPGADPAPLRARIHDLPLGPPDMDGGVSDGPDSSPAP